VNTTSDLSPPAFDLSETVAAQPPANALLMVERYAQRIAWGNKYQARHSIPVGEALRAFLDQFPPMQRINLIAHYVRSFTAANRSLGRKYHTCR